MRGWFYDRYRHQLAARGVRSSFYRKSNYIKYVDMRPVEIPEEVEQKSENLVQEKSEYKFDPLTSGFEAAQNLPIESKKPKVLMSEEDRYNSDIDKNRGSRWSFANMENDENKLASSIFITPQKPDPEKETEYVNALKNGDPVDAIRLESYVTGEALAENIKQLSGFTVGYKDKRD